jgi:hypothetical protein
MSAGGFKGLVAAVPGTGPASGAGAGGHPWCVSPVSRFPKSRLIGVLRLTGGIPVPAPINRRTGINRGNVTAGAGDPASCRTTGGSRSRWEPFAILQCAEVQFHYPRPGPGRRPRIPPRFLNTTSTAGTRPVGAVPPRPRGPAGCLRPSGPPSGAYPGPGFHPASAAWPSKPPLPQLPCDRLAGPEPQPSHQPPPHTSHDPHTSRRDMSSYCGAGGGYGEDGTAENELGNTS